MKSAHRSNCRKPDPELLLLQDELKIAQSNLAVAYRQLDQALDPDLVESCVYQISALHARCNYLLRAIKAHRPDLRAASAVKGDTAWT